MAFYGDIFWPKLILYLANIRTNSMNSAFYLTLLPLPAKKLIATNNIDVAAGLMVVDDEFRDYITNSEDSAEYKRNFIYSYTLSTGKGIMLSASAQRGYNDLFGIDAAMLNNPNFVLR